jgi:hypothetical protein
MPQIELVDDAFGAGAKGRRGLGSVTLDVDRIRVKDLIRLRVEAAHAARWGEGVAGSGVGSLAWLRDLATKRPAPDVDRQIDIARAAFGRNGFFRIFNGRQLADFDELVPLDAVNEVIFLEVTPLEGG